MPEKDPVDVFGGDETFIAVGPERLAPLIKDGAAHRDCWPDLEFRVTRDRGVKGCQWAVTGTSSSIAGTAEVWLEPWQDGTVVHLYLRLRVPPDRRGRVRPDAAVREHGWRRWITGVKDEFDRERQVGSPPTASR